MALLCLTLAKSETQTATNVRSILLVSEVQCVLPMSSGEFPLTVDLRTLPIGRNILSVSAVLVDGSVINGTILLTGRGSGISLILTFVYC